MPLIAGSAKPSIAETRTNPDNRQCGAVTLGSLAKLDWTTWFDVSLWHSVCNGPVSSVHVAHWIRKLTPYARLSAMQRMLLATDGSVTLLMEALTGRPIRIRILAQEILPVSRELAAEIEVAPGTELNHRVAAMCDGDRVMCIGSSLLLSDRLPKRVVERLRSTNISLGKLIFQPRVGVQRRPVSVDVVTPPEHLARQVPLGERLLVRHSRLTIQRDTVGSLREWFLEPGE